MRRFIIWSVAVVLLLGIVAYASRQSGDRSSSPGTWTVSGGNPQQGKRLIVAYGCGACHVVDGINRANGRVGPKLQGIQEQIYVGGVLPNTAKNMVSWIMSPQEFSPGTAMPDLDVSEQDARHMAAYLFTKS